MNDTLRDYQQEMKLRLFKEWELHRSVMVQMPTGTGKTHLLAAIVREFLRGSGSRVWIVAHRRELVEQIEETVSRHGMSKEDGRVRVMSIQWLSRNRKHMDEEPDLIVIDEAHHAGLAKGGDRSAYLDMPDILKALGDPVVMAATATATAPVVAELARMLPITHTVVDETVRENLQLEDDRDLASRENRLVSIVATGAKLQAKSAPITTPIKRDEYASLVISASVMAMMGGTSAQKVPTNCMMFLLSCATKHRTKKLSHDFHHDLTQKHQTTDVKHIKAPDRVDHDSTPSFRTTVRRVFPDDPSIDKTGILSTLRRRPLPHPTVSCRLSGATFVSRASIKTYEIACSIHLFSILSSKKSMLCRKMAKNYTHERKTEKFRSDFCGKQRELMPRSRRA